MGDNPAIDGRLSVRTPMQWAPGPGAGFSGADPGRLIRPLADGRFGPDRVNVAQQRRDPGSLLRFVSRLAGVRRRTPELGLGASTLIENEPAPLFAHRCDWEGSTVVALHNLAAEPVSAELDLGEEVVALDDLLELREHRVRRGRARFALDPYGYLWLRARRGG